MSIIMFGMSGGLFAHKTLSQFMLLGGLVLH